jgi:hypothetical protein
MSQLLEAVTPIARLGDDAAFEIFLERLPRPLRPDVEASDGPRDRWGLLFHQLVETPLLKPWNRLIAALRDELGADDDLEHFVQTVRRLQLPEAGGR